MPTHLLSGRCTRDTECAPDDHRTFNRHGEARSPEQARATAAVAELAPLSCAATERIDALYRDKIAPYVHQRWQRANTLWS